MYGSLNGRECEAYFEFALNQDIVKYSINSKLRQFQVIDGHHFYDFCSLFEEIVVSYTKIVVTKETDSTFSFKLGVQLKVPCFV